MIFLLIFSEGFSADYTVKDAKSYSPEKDHIITNGDQKADFQLKQEYTASDIQGIVNNIGDIEDYSGNKLELEKTDSPDNKDSEQVRSNMIAGAMGIGIF